MKKISDEENIRMLIKNNFSKS